MKQLQAFYFSQSSNWVKRLSSMLIEGLAGEWTRILHFQADSNMRNQSNVEQKRLKKSCFTRKIGLMMLVMSGVAQTARAAVTVPSIISNHAVFQKSEKTRIWGKGTQPNEVVKVSIGDVKQETKVDSAGNWLIELNTSKLGEGPFDLTIEAANKIVVSDVLLGDIWVCSGQSNMDRRMDLTENFEEEVKNSANNRLRHFHILSKSKDGLQPQDDCTGKWEIAGPETTPGFTAVGYYFAKQLIQTLDRPVGLVHGSVPGTPAEEWMTPESVDKDPNLTPTRDKVLAEIAGNPAKRQAYIDGTHQWESQYQRADQPTTDPAIYNGKQVDTSDWKKVTLPGKLSDAGLPDSGIVWLRKEITIDGPIGNSTWIDIINPGGYETIYWNEKQVVSIKPENMQVPTGARRYFVQKQYINEGKNVIAIRLHSPMGDAGITGDVKRFVAGPVSLQGEWLAKVQTAFPPLDPKILSTYPENPKAPQSATSRLFNGYIAPVVNSTIRGVIWYQGEANVVRGYQYRTTFPELIQGWRDKWGFEMPFYYCQLANISAKKNIPGDMHRRNCAKRR
ncbi:MAG: sialate O-acetylesterase [Pirellulales bacterium]